MSELAIVLPAYKGRFFRDCLFSIVNQDNTDFTLYIGDDASPDDLESIVKEFDGALNYVYHRFETNWGRQSLIRQWQRCIALVKDEKWIWLFGDDDLMAPTCVTRFYECMRTEEGEYDIYRINTVKINEAGLALRQNDFPELVTAGSFLELKIAGSVESYVIEYIFLKKKYEEFGGIPEFPLGWASDDAFWLLFASQKPIRTISGATVYWRYSDYNISGNSRDGDHVKLKIAACYQFLAWVKENRVVAGNADGGRLMVKWYSDQLCWLGQAQPVRTTVLAFLKCLRIFPLQGLYALYSFMRNLHRP